MFVWLKDYMVFIETYIAKYPEFVGLLWILIFNFIAVY